MKRTIIGCCLFMVGAFSDIALLLFSGYFSTTIGSYNIPPGRLMTTMDVYELTGPMYISTTILLIGLIILAIEYFRR